MPRKKKEIKPRKQRTMICKSCNKEFKASRIDAKYCCEGCRSYAHRRRNNPELYGAEVPINILLDQNTYEELIFRARDFGLTPEKYLIKDLINKSTFSFPLELDTNEYYLLKSLFEGHTADSWISRFKEWLMDRMNKETFESINKIIGE